ncbi:MAG: glycosyltransferase family 1 protein [Pseudomonadota bacterium]
MRIGVDARPLNFPNTGIGRYTAQLLKVLWQQSEHSWYLYADRPILKQLPEHVSIRTANNNLPALSTLYAQANFARWARQDDVDLFWSPRHHLPLRTAAGKTMVTIHDLVWEKAPDTMKALGKTVDAWLMPRAIRQADAILVPSHSTRQDIEDKWPQVADRVHITPLASSLALAKRDSDQSGVKEIGNPITLLFVGSLEPRKNLPNILRAFDQLCQSYPGRVNLLVAGGGGWKSDEAQADLHKHPNVQVLGDLDDLKLSELYSRADVLLAPSLYEGFGLPIVEAMGFGVPAVTSNVSSMREFAHAGATLVDPCSVEGICAGITRLIEEPDYYAACVKAATQASSSYSWEKCGQQTLRVIEALS